MNSRADGWFEELSADKKPILEGLRGLALSCGEEILEEIKWSRPVYSSGGKSFCYLYFAKNHCTLGFDSGAFLTDPEGLLEGTGKGMRHIEVRAVEEFDEEVLRAMIVEAAAMAELESRTKNNKR